METPVGAGDDKKTNSDGDPRSGPGMTRKPTTLTVMPDKINRHA